MKMIDLFSGIGGFSLAGENNGIETVCFVEKDKYCQKVLNKNFPNIPIHKDIYEFKTEKYKSVDIVAGGFPCQPFSIAGKRKGTKDNRYLWNEMYIIIKEAKPKWVIAENVYGLVNIEQGLVFGKIISDLESENYEVQTFIIPAVSVNAPHRRDRLWIIANSTCQRFKARRQWNERIKTKKSYLKSPTKQWGERTSISQICGIHDGISKRVDRLRVLGNSIVPQIANEIFRIIKEIEK